MKKILYELILITAILIFAQYFAKSDELDSISDISMIIGLNYFIAQQELYRVDYDNDLFDTGLPIGLNLGVIYKLNDELSFRSELIYNSKILYDNKTYDIDEMILSKLMMNLLFCYNHKLDNKDIFTGIGPSFNVILGNSFLIMTSESGYSRGRFTSAFLAFDIGFTMIAGLSFPLSDWTKISCGLNYNINNLNETLLNKPTKNWYGNVGGLNIFCNIIFNFDGESNENL